MAYIRLPVLSKKVGTASPAINHHAFTNQPFAFSGALVVTYQ
jgi:hypothetical protein